MRDSIIVGLDIVVTRDHGIFGPKSLTSILSTCLVWLHCRLLLLIRTDGATLLEFVFSLLPSKEFCTYLICHSGTYLRLDF